MFYDFSHTHVQKTNALCPILLPYTGYMRFMAIRMEITKI